MTAPSDHQKEATPAGGDLVKRHRLSTRVWHWTNAAVFFIMLMSGLMIFNAHPRLYWGEYGANYDPAWLEISARDTSEGGIGFIRVGEAEFNTTGVFGLYSDSKGGARALAFPPWMTLPSSYNLAVSRNWHLTFAWVFALGLFVYAIRSLFNGHIRRDLFPTMTELRPSHIVKDIANHARLRFPKGVAALRYNILQKSSYIAVIGILIPLMILTGFTMSPALDARFPFLLDLFGGRQSARSIHFIIAFLLVLFVVVHLVMVILAGPFNEIRSMITGYFRLPKEKK